MKMFVSRKDNGLNQMSGSSCYENVHFDPSLELSLQDSSNDGSKYMCFYEKIQKFFFWSNVNCILIVVYFPKALVGVRDPHYLKHSR